MDIHTNNGIKRVCFCKDRYQIFEELNNSTTAGCVLKNVKKNSDDILINDSSKIRKMELDFDKCLDIEITEINTILNQYSLYQIPTVEGLVTGLTQIKYTDKNCCQVPMRTGFLHDKSGSAPNTFFGDTCNNINNDQSLQLTNKSLSKYKSDRMLKSTEITKVMGVEMESFNIDGRQKSQNEITTCKIVSVVLSTLTTTYKCADCKCPVLLDEGFVTCTNCSGVIIEMHCVKNDKEEGVVIDQDSKSKKHTLISLELLQIISKTLIQNKVAFAKLVIAKTRTVEYNPNDMVVVVIKESEEQ